MVTDPLADMFARIKNAQAVGAAATLVPYSKLKMEIAKNILEAGFIKEIGRRVRKNKKFLEIVLAYDEKGKPRISGIKRISKPGRRIYLPVSRIGSVRQGRGITVISTSRGIMTDKEARKKWIGGEVICKIW